MRSRLIERLVAGVVLGALLFTAPEAAAQSTPKRSLLIISKTSHTLAIVDPASLKVLARVPVGEDPHEVIASSDGRTAYVSNTGFGRFHELNVIDLVAQKALPSIDTAPLIGPHGLAFVGGKVWFTAQGAKAVARYDPTTARVDWSMGTGQNRTHMLHVTADEKKIYTTNVDSGTVSILENVLLQPTLPPTGVLPPGAQPQMDWIQTLIPVAQSSEGFDVSPDGQELWTASPGGALSIINLAAKKVTATVAAKLPGAHRLMFTPDGKRVLIVSVRTGELVIYDARARKEIKRLNIGHGGAMLMDAEGARAFVSCPPDNDVAVIDLKTLEVTGRLDVGGRPDGLAWAVRQ
ncbi:YncE family protein [Cystobacter fuscus]|uniref:YncE family protein n=1 Tax=Cystobacter fuscus TaxID=43 RepID=UPI002B2FE396|nr:YncE family protein [Cystobacter fuscus]